MGPRAQGPSCQLTGTLTKKAATSNSVCAVPALAQAPLESSSGQKPEGFTFTSGSVIGAFAPHVVKHKEGTISALA